MDRRKWVVLVFIIIFLFGAEYYLFSDKAFYHDDESHEGERHEHARHKKNDEATHTSGPASHDSV